ncbi:cbb3-type cytochrome oxidase assembly protein CcoS [Ancylomarina euxinus]|uniref:Cbb3-type cytochrome oxidase assembly protein CcoS n=1 Tax=Ancylomarina euxinus TaxID=2283627 RepID=A0A425Y3G2_9BACT|nr:cbb3-type cytochrome oxidase assembly protein CcoS [Ancylomarina euxinus]MCZ4693179.1 cbb3-type cytochrome oxidase assembly protein CcoS [Ancylomarina euxinus]MUP15317.1 cbb3-type cytochrome oxidase assembly protein CcoS [Ancylomarina euxinus]RRG22554.1 cbb3-type cytochrome oxidase assembly protein CcoS [Ancylomarina euxinus]
MSVIFVLIGVSMVVAGGFLIGFLWAVKKGQYDDHYSPSVRILFDDQEIKDQENEETHGRASKQEESENKDKKEDDSKSSQEN